MAADKKKKDKGGKMTKPLIAVFLVVVVGLIIRFYTVYSVLPFEGGMFTKFLKFWNWVL